MTKIHFRFLVVITFLISMSCGFFDMAVPNETLKSVMEYSETLEPEWSDNMMILMGGYFLLGLVITFYTFLGLLLFWNYARHIYLLGFILSLPMYWVAEIIVSSGVAQALCDTVFVLSGFILALIYFSSVKTFFVEKATSEISPSIDKVS